jgi:hypothetical protein
MRRPPQGKAVRKIGFNTWAITWRGIPMEAVQDQDTWLYYCTSPAFQKRICGRTPREVVKRLGREINSGEGFRLVRWSGMYGNWYLYTESPHATYGPLVMTWPRRPRRDEVLAAIALAKLERCA